MLSVCVSLSTRQEFLLEVRGDPQEVRGDPELVRLWRNFRLEEKQLLITTDSGLAASFSCA